MRCARRKATELGSATAMVILDPGHVVHGAAMVVRLLEHADATAEKELAATRVVGSSLRRAVGRGERVGGVERWWSSPECADGERRRRQRFGGTTRVEEGTTSLDS